MTISRRLFLVSATAFLATPSIVRATPGGRVGPNRLWVIRISNGETLDAPIRLGTEDGTRRAWMLWSHFWRDVKDNDRAVWIDPALLHLLSDIQIGMSRHRGEEVPILLTSGYRTPERNATIRGAAPESFHVRGRAADFGGRGLRSAEVAEIARSSPRVGGLGRYADFTHVDTGPRRTWNRA